MSLQNINQIDSSKTTSEYIIYTVQLAKSPITSITK